MEIVNKWFEIYDHVVNEGKKRFDTLPGEYFKDVTTAIFIQISKESNIGKMNEAKGNQKQANPLINATKENPVKGIKFLGAVTDKYDYQGREQTRYIIKTNLGDITLGAKIGEQFGAQKPDENSDIIGYQASFKGGKPYNVLEVVKKALFKQEDEAPF